MSTTTIAERSLGPLLGRLAAGAETGVVTAVRQNHKRLFCLQNGKAVLAISNVVEEQFEHRLTRDGLLAEGALIAARKQADEEGLELCPYLMTQEHPGAEQLRSAMLRHVRDLVDSTLTWDRGEFTFARGRPKVKDELTVTLALPPVLLAHAQSVDHPLGFLRVKIGPPNATPFIEAKHASFLSEADRHGVVEFLLQNCAGSASVDELCEASPGDSEETIRTLYALALMGLIEQPHDHKEAPKIDATVTRAECDALLGKNYTDHYSVLGLERNVLGGDIRDAYYYLARRYHPDRFRAGPLMDLQEQVEAYFTKVTEAYNTLIDEVTRAEYDSQIAERVRKDVRPKEDEAHLAKTNYARARVLIDKRRFQDSVQFLENAVKLDDSKADYHMELGRVLVRNPRRRPEAVQHLTRAIEINPASVAAHMALAELYGKMDRSEEAAEAYREVLRWEPTNSLAKQELAELDLDAAKAKKTKKKKEGDDGGMLRGLFRKK